jgi:hypothetical protein
MFENQHIFEFVFLEPLLNTNLFALVFHLVFVSLAPEFKILCAFYLVFYLRLLLSSFSVLLGNSLDNCHSFVPLKRLK